MKATGPRYTTFSFQPVTSRLYSNPANAGAGAVLFFSRNVGLDAGFNSASSGGYANIAIIF